MVRQVGRFFERATGLEESRYTGCSADMISNPVRKSGLLRPVLKHGKVLDILVTQNLRGFTLKIG